MNVTDSIELFAERCVKRSETDKRCIMKSIIMTYPDFQSLPKGIKRMLVASESFFFRETESRLKRPRDAAVTARTILRANRGYDLSGPSSAFGAAWRN